MARQGLGPCRLRWETLLTRLCHSALCVCDLPCSWPLDHVKSFWFVSEKCVENQKVPLDLQGLKEGLTSPGARVRASTAHMECDFLPLNRPFWGYLGAPGLCHWGRSPPWTSLASGVRGSPEAEEVWQLASIPVNTFCHCELFTCHAEACGLLDRLVNKKLVGPEVAWIPGGWGHVEKGGCFPFSILWLETCSDPSSSRRKSRLHSSPW